MELFHTDDIKVLGILSGSPGLTMSVVLPILSRKAHHLSLSPVCGMGPPPTSSILSLPLLDLPVVRVLSAL